MANRHGHYKSKVFLGFEDELITKQYDSYLSYTTNKVGGKPFSLYRSQIHLRQTQGNLDFHPSSGVTSCWSFIYLLPTVNTNDLQDWGGHELLANPKCLLCGLSLPLIIQIYAPLEGSQYHRTLYLFSCVNPSCWNKKQSWVCLRRQFLDENVAQSTSNMKNISSFDWCEGANDWEDFETDESENVVSEQEANVESEHFISKMAELEVKESGEEKKDPNEYCFSLATAELEDDQRDPVTVETPVAAQVDVAAIYHQVKPVPQLPPESLQFTSFFISVCEEKEEKLLDNLSTKAVVVGEDTNPQTNVAIANSDISSEKYEKILPAHGDKLFHNFISRIQRNPGQILRYIRECGAPLFLYPAEDVPQHCVHCGGGLVYELQLLPTLISRLHLLGSGPGHLDYGSVFLLTCKQSCWDPQHSVRTEHVLVQREL